MIIVYRANKNDGAGRGGGAAAEAGGGGKQERRKKEWKRWGEPDLFIFKKTRGSQRRVPRLSWLEW